MKKRKLWEKRKGNMEKRTKGKGAGRRRQKIGKSLMAEEAEAQKRIEIKERDKESKKLH